MLADSGGASVFYEIARHRLPAVDVTYVYADGGGREDHHVRDAGDTLFSMSLNGGHVPGDDSLHFTTTSRCRRRWC